MARIHNRGRYDWGKVRNDLPIMPVIRVVRTVKLAYPVIFTTGRMEQCRDATSAWITQYVCDHELGSCFCHSPMEMREDDDMRSAQVVKREMYAGALNALPGTSKYGGIRAQYDVQGVFDDHDKSVRMWREDFGFTVFDVAGNSFG